MRRAVRRLIRCYWRRVSAVKRSSGKTTCLPPATQRRGPRGQIQAPRKDRGRQSDAFPFQPRRRHRVPRARSRKDLKGRRVRSSSCGACAPRRPVHQDRRGARRRRAPPGNPARVRRLLPRLGLPLPRACVCGPPPQTCPRPPMIGELENREYPVPTTFSTRGRLDIRRRLPDRMVKESGAVTAGAKPVLLGFPRPRAARTAPQSSYRVGALGSRSLFGGQHFRRGRRPGCGSWCPSRERERGRALRDGSGGGERGSRPVRHGERTWHLPSRRSS